MLETAPLAICVQDRYGSACPNPTPVVASGQPSFAADYAFTGDPFIFSTG